MCEVEHSLYLVFYSDHSTGNLLRFNVNWYLKYIGSFYLKKFIRVNKIKIHISEILHMYI